MAFSMEKKSEIFKNNLEKPTKVIMICFVVFLFDVIAGNKLLWMLLAMGYKLTEMNKTKTKTSSSNMCICV